MHYSVFSTERLEATLLQLQHSLGKLDVVYDRESATTPGRRTATLLVCATATSFRRGSCCWSIAICTIQSTSSSRCRGHCCSKLKGPCAAMHACPTKPKNGGGRRCRIHCCAGSTASYWLTESDRIGSTTDARPIGGGDGCRVLRPEIHSAPVSSASSRAVSSSFFFAL
jgi:hypothetical protein